MLEQNGHVVAIEGDEALVETSRQSSCGSCEAKGCGTGSLSQVLGRKTQQLRVKNPVAAKPGEAVVLGLSESALIRGSLAVYMVPLVALLGGGLLGEVLGRQMGWPGELGAITLAVLSLIGALLWLRGFSRRAGVGERYQAVILRRAGGPTQKPIHFHTNN